MKAEYLKVFLDFVFLAVSIPVGLWIAKHTKEELADGKKWFVFIFIASFLLGIFYLFYGNFTWALTLFSLTIIAGVSFLKAKN